MADPSARGVALKAVRNGHPDWYVPEVDVAEDVRKELDGKIKPLASSIDALTKRFDDAIASSQQAQYDAQQRAAWDAAISQNRLTKQGVESVSKLMQERGIADPRDAAELLIARGGAASVTAQASAIPQETPEQKERASLLGRDAREWAHREFSDGVRAIMGNRR